MKNFQHFEKWESEVDILFGAPLSVNTSGRDSNLKRQNQNVVESQAISDNPSVADRVRNYCLHILIFILTSNAVFGKIRNGYEKNISGTRQSLTILHAKLQEDENITPWQRRKTQSAIATLVDHVAYYDLTEGLLLQFKTIAPELYAQIDTISDRLGRPVDVYIKFVPVDGTSVKAWGLTYMGQSSDDKDAYQSEYGELTVSVKIWIVRSALLVLAHELGHVKYQVPNLASYFEFYKKHYDTTPGINSMGHDIDDPSGKWATQFGRTFQKKYADFLKSSIEKVQNPLVVLAKLRRDWSKNALSYKTIRPTHEMESRSSAAVASSKKMAWATSTSQTVVPSDTLHFKHSVDYSGHSNN